MKKTIILAIVALTACALQSATFAAEPATPATQLVKPNILVILADDLRYDCIGAVNPLIHTPNIDRLAKRGVRFSNCYLAGANVAGVCLPSRIQIMAGCSPFHLPVDSATPGKPGEQPSVPVMPTVFRAAGYDSLYCGKSGNTYCRANYAFDKHIFINIEGGVNRDKGKELEFRRRFANPVVSFLGDAARTQRPFLVFYAPCTPHDPLYCEPDCLKLYQGDKRPPLPPTAAVDHKAFAGFLQHDTNIRPYDVPGVGGLKYPFNLNIWRDVIAQYYAMVSSFDRDVGRILDELERTGAITNTIIVFTSDNGLALSDHGLIHKSSLYEHEVKLPLIVCGPGIPQGKCSDAFVYHSDMLPTLCELTGTPIPDTVHTKSFRTSLFDPAAPARKTLTFAYTEEMRGYRDDQFKIILYSNHTAQLFDLKNDPQEVHDLAKKPEHAQRLAAMIEELRAANKADGDYAGKKIANIFRLWPQTACRLPKDGPMLWEVWGKPPSVLKKTVK